MRGFPRHIATVQDFRNLLANDGFKEQALSVLNDIYNLDDSKATRATTLIDPEDPKSDWNTEVIDNPMPLWKQKGFGSRQAVADLIAQ
jgi:hypothetical protein